MQAGNDQCEVAVTIPVRDMPLDGDLSVVYWRDSSVMSCARYYRYKVVRDLGAANEQLVFLSSCKAASKEALLEIAKKTLVDFLKRENDER